MILPKTKETRTKLQVLYSVCCPVVNMVGYEDWLDKKQLDEYQFNAALHIQDIFDKEEAPDYHAMIYLSECNLMAKPSYSYGRMYLWMCKNYFKDRLELGDFDDIVLDSNEIDDLKRFKRWIFKKQIEHLKQKIKNTGGDLVAKM